MAETMRSDLMEPAVDSQRTVAKPSLVFYTPDDIKSDPALRATWESMVPWGNSLNRAYAGPPVFETHARNNPHEGNRVAVIRNNEGVVIGVCPVVRWDLSIPFQVRKYSLGKINLQCATVLSGEPMLPQEPALFDMLVDGLLSEFEWCDCVYFLSIPADSFTSHLIYDRCARGRRRYFVHPARLKPSEWLYHELEENFEKYIQSQRSRARSNCKRRLKRFRDFANGMVECQRVQTEQEVDEFYASASPIAEKSWQHQTLGLDMEETALNRESLMNHARLGTLRAYLLKCAGKPCAYWIGYQYQDTLLSEQMAYMSEYSAYSPGIVLMYLLLEDVYSYRRPRYLHFGSGVNPAKRLFANRRTFDTGIYLLRPTLRNRLRATSLGLFSATYELARRLLKKRGNGADSDGQSDEL